jgi:hypothetical protein
LEIEGTDDEQEDIVKINWNKLAKKQILVWKRSAIEKNQIAEYEFTKSKHLPNKNFRALITNIHKK